MLGNRKVMGINIQRYMDKVGIGRKEFADAIGVPYSSLTDWINGKSYPRIDKIEKMANYFGINKADLVEEHTNDQPYYLDPETRELAEELHKNPQYRALLDASRKLTPDEMRAIMQLIRTMAGDNDDT